MADYSNIGLFRGNEYGNRENNFKMADRTTPGTPGQDQGAIVTGGATAFSGIRYTGKDGVSKIINFFHEEVKTMRAVPYSVPVGDPDALKWAIHDLLTKLEVDPIVNVTNAAGTYTVTHIGAGELEAVIMDGGEEPLTRGATPAGAMSMNVFALSGGQEELVAQRQQVAARAEPLERMSTVVDGGEETTNKAKAKSRGRKSKATNKAKEESKEESSAAGDDK